MKQKQVKEQTKQHQEITLVNAIKVGAYKVHPLAMDVHALMPPALYQEIEDSVREDGLLVAIPRWHGVILDGIARLKSCLKLGIEPRFEDIDSLKAERVVKQIALYNMRRDLKTVERCELALKGMEQQRLLAETRKKAGKETVDGGTSWDLAAKPWRLSGSTLKRYAALSEEEKDAIRMGLKSINELYEEKREARAAAKAAQAGKKDEEEKLDDEERKARAQMLRERRKRITWGDLLDSEAIAANETYKVLRLAAHLVRDKDDSDKVKHWIAELQKTLEEEVIGTPLAGNSNAVGNNTVAEAA